MSSAACTGQLSSGSKGSSSDTECVLGPDCQADGASDSPTGSDSDGDQSSTDGDACFGDGCSDDTPDVCGDGQITGTELCDTLGPQVGTATCVGEGYPGGGQLGCSAGCHSFDFSGCNSDICPDGRCGATENCTSCPADCGTCNPDSPLFYEPYEFVSPPVTVRSASELAASNGCFSRDLTEKQDRGMCVATTRPITDLVSETSTTHSRAGSSSMRFLLRPCPLADWPTGEATHRNEIAGRGSWNYYPNICVDAGCDPIVSSEERWYGLSVFFPEDFIFAPAAIANNIRFIFAQWQHGTAGSPAVAFEVMGDAIELVLAGGSTSSIQGIDREVVATITRGEWIDFVVRVV